MRNDHPAVGSAPPESQERPEPRGPRLGRRQLLTGTLLGAASAPFAASAAQAAPRATTPAAAGVPARSVVPGADRAHADGWSVLAGERVGVITNPTGVLRSLRNVVDEMHASGAVDLVGVFGPEHGFRGTAQAGGSEGTFVDERTGLTVYDAYGAGVAKMTELFRAADVETVVFDIQDVGARFYTYIWTMWTAMQAAVATGSRFVVLDRPNPVGGTARGPMMAAGYTSGVGAKEIVQAHGMTVGELARFFDGEFLPDVAGARLDRLDVVEVAGWRRDVTFAGTGLDFVMPSPNMPTPDTALAYPGTCMFEGTNLSEGRGTTRPFELIGAPYVDHRWAAALTEAGLPGVLFREAYFNPTFNKHAGTVCGGVQVTVDDPARFDPVRTGVAMLVTAAGLYPEFAWREDSWDPARPFWIDKLTGSPRLRQQIDAGATTDDVVAAWQDELAEFDRRRQQYLLYRGPRS
ncbi:exo-beta-N-acetylmuramidase NamZ family protein [Isoptericola variabilis]|uniref:exo-beta-N-acetylmuramidase NamZ family protein n=1 Tax=Isoptericola variabilis TaxID=139208 RepID=UPI003D197FEC